MKILLPAVIQAPNFYKDGSTKISFESRELSAEEIFTILALRNGEGWLCYAPNEDEIDIPEERAEIDEKTPSERLRAVLYVWFQQEVESGKYVGLFDNFKREKMEKIIQTIKSKLR